MVEIPHEQPIEPPIYKEIRPGKTRPATNIGRHPKRRGEEGELAFMRRAIAEGFAIAKPWGDSERYDFILDNGIRLWRVQVRSTDREVHKGFAVHAYSKAGPKLMQLTAREVDVIAAYLIPKDIWYIVPIEACTGKNLWFFPDGRKRSRFEKFREAWDHLRPPGANETVI
jgi:PD-(D/E)XK endonuclease